MTIQMRLGLNSMRDLAPRIMAAVDAEMEDAAEEIEFLMKELAPVDTGFLRDNIHVVRIDHLALQVRSDAPYSAWVNWGTSRMPAQPFVEPAIEAVRAGYETRIARRIREDALS